MTTLVLHSRLLTGRSLRTLARQPAYLALTLVQPMIWLLLFGQLFKQIGQTALVQSLIVFGVSHFLPLPLSFLSSVMMAPAMMPGWVAHAAAFNPVDWAAVASRSALATLTFQSYRRSA